MNLTVVSSSLASSDLPVSLAEAKDHLYITHDEDNDQIGRKAEAAVQYVEGRFSGHRRLMRTVYDLRLPSFPYQATRITLPLPPLYSVVSISYVDSEGDTQTLSTDDYTVFTPTDSPGFVELAYNESWPSTRAVPDAVTIRFIAGYANAASVPAAVKEAVLLKLENLFDPERAPEASVKRAIDSLIAPYQYGHYS